MFYEPKRRSPVSKDARGRMAGSLRTGEARAHHRATGTGITASEDDFYRLAGFAFGEPGCSGVPFSAESKMVERTLQRVWVRPTQAAEIDSFFAMEELHPGITSLTNFLAY